MVKLFVGAPAGLLPVAAQGDARALRDNEVRKLMPLREQAIGAADAAHFPQLHSTGVVVSGDAAGMPAFMMSRMRGRALSGCVDELSGAIGGVPTAQALLALLRCALRPLAVLERVGIVHGDLNLGNVFVELAEGPDGAAQPVWVGLVDLGAARGAGLLTTRTGVPSVHGGGRVHRPGDTRSRKRVPRGVPQGPPRQRVGAGVSRLLSQDQAALHRPHEAAPGRGER